MPRSNSRFMERSITCGTVEPAWAEPAAHAYASHEATAAGIPDEEGRIFAWPGLGPATSSLLNARIVVTTRFTRGPAKSPAVRILITPLRQHGVIDQGQYPRRTTVIC